MLARVYNDHPVYGKKAYSETFRDDLLTIPPMGHIEMEKSEACMFLGQFIPIRQRDNGDPLTTKALRMEVFHRCKQCKEELVNDELLREHLHKVHAQQLKTEVIHRCHKCKEEFKSEEDLITHGIDRHEEILIDKDLKRKK